MSLHRTRTIAVLKAMEKNELKELSGFIHSPLSKASPMVKKSFDFLKLCLPDFNHKKCSKEAFSEKVFGKKIDRTSGAEINRLMSELLEVFERFIVYQSAASDALYRNDALIYWYGKKALSSHVRKVFRDFEEAIAANSLPDTPLAYKKYLEQKINETVRNASPQQSYMALKSLGKFLDTYCGIEKQINETGVVNLVNFLGPDATSEADRGKIVPDFLAIDFNKELLYYQKLHQLTVQPDEATYHYLFGCLDDKSLRISENDRGRLLTILANQIKMIFSDEAFSREILRMLEYRAKIRQVKNGGYIHHVEYQEFIIYYCHLKKINEAEAFLQSVGNKISGVEDVPAFVDVYRAHVLFEKKQFTEALELASRSKGEATLTGVHIRMLKMKIAYELNDARMFDAHVNNLRKFVATRVKKELHPLYEQRLLRFASYVSRLFKIKPGNTASLNKLKQDVDKDPSALNKPWIGEKIAAKLPR